MNAFSTAFTRGLPHGIVAAVHLPNPSDEISPKILHRLHADERVFVESLGGKRRNEWIGGRLAARVAASAIGFDLGPLLPDDYGAPSAPKSLTISIAHKDQLAIALVARKKYGSVGVDFEIIDRERTHIASKILVPNEMKDVEALGEERQWNAVLLRFALKEAVYKAIAPRARRYIGFDEAEISNVSDGYANINLMLKTGQEPKEIDGRYDWMPEGLVTSVRVRWD